MNKIGKAAILLEIEEALFEMSNEERLRIRAVVFGIQETFLEQEADQRAKLQAEIEFRKPVVIDPVGSLDVARVLVTQKKPPL